MGRDEWVCRIPRQFLEDLAATRTLDRSTTVLIALLLKLYGEDDNSGSSSPTGTASLSWLSTKTGRHIREVRHAMTALAAAGVVVTIEAPAGREKILRLEGGSKRPRGETPHGSETPHTPGRNAAHPVSKRRRVEGGETPHTLNEVKNVLQGTFLQRTVDVTDIDRARLSNGNGHVQLRDTLDLERATRIRWCLEDNVETCQHFRGIAHERWMHHVQQLSGELAGRADLSESTIGRRARRFFVVEAWSDLGDSKQARHLWQHMLQKVSKHKKAASK